MAAVLKDLGILFRGDMVRALLAGAKRQTRRPIRPPAWATVEDCLRALAEGWPGIALLRAGSPARRWTFPYAPVGRRLWVRERWAPHPSDTQDPPEWVVYHADRSAWGAVDTQPEHVNRPIPSLDLDRDPSLREPRWRPSLLMPRWASRLTLRVTSLRAGPLTAITPEDVLAEGFDHAGLGTRPEDYCRTYRAMHGLGEHADPWVWVVEFERDGVERSAVPRG